jgi:secreted Zn-dependent insulinase-like peptidase
MLIRLFYLQELEIHARAYQLPLNTNNVLRIRSLMHKDDNSLIKCYYQIGRRTIQGNNLGEIFEAFASPKVFDFLRSQHQLGYDVGASLETNGGTLGFGIYVVSQENKHKFTEVHEKIDEFVVKMLEDVSSISDQEFEILKKNRLKTLKADDMTLGEEFARNWLTIQNEYYMFNRQEIFANVTAKLTKAEFIYFVNSFLQPEKQRSVCIQVIGTEGEGSDENEIDDDVTVEFITEKHGDDENVISDIEAFQRNLYLYPALKVLE